MNFSESLFFTSNTLQRHLQTMADDVFGPLGLSSSYAFLLMIVHDQPGIQPTELSKRLQLTPSTISRLVEKMEYRGYLERTSSGRSTHISSTKEGKKLYPKLERAWVNLRDRYTNILGKRYTNVLSEMMAKASDQIMEADS